MLQRIKCVCCILILLCIIGINLSHAKTDIDELMKSAVGVWLFDEGKGKVAEDISKEGNDGKVVKAEWVKGKFGKALE